MELNDIVAAIRRQITMKKDRQGIKSLKEVVGYLVG